MCLGLLDGDSSVSDFSGSPNLNEMFPQRSLALLSCTPAARLYPGVTWWPPVHLPSKSGSSSPSFYPVLPAISVRRCSTANADSACPCHTSTFLSDSDFLLLLMVSCPPGPAALGFLFSPDSTHFQACWLFCSLTFLSLFPVFLSLFHALCLLFSLLKFLSSLSSSFLAPYFQELPITC